MAARTRYGTGQAGEYLVASELARNAFTVALPTGNAPGIDILAYSHGYNFSVQVKTVSRGSHQFNLGSFVDVEFLEGGGQEVKGLKLGLDRNIHLALVFLADKPGEDRVLWATVGDLADFLAERHKAYLSKHGGRRPGKSPKSLHSAIKEADFDDDTRFTTFQANFEASKS